MDPWGPRSNFFKEPLASGARCMSCDQRGRVAAGGQSAKLGAARRPSGPHEKMRRRQLSVGDAGSENQQAGGNGCPVGALCFKRGGNRHKRGGRGKAARGASRPKWRTARKLGDGSVLWAIPEVGAKEPLASGRRRPSCGLGRANRAAGGRAAKLAPKCTPCGQISGRRALCGPIGGPAKKLAMAEACG